MGWISKMLGREAGGERGPWVKSLAKTLTQLDKQKGARSGLADDILAYVEDGAPQRVLGDVHAADASTYFGLTGYLPEGRFIRLYEGFETAPVGERLRWAQVLEASLPANQTYLLSFVLPPGTQWLEALLLHVAGRQINTWISEAPSAKALTMAGMEAMQAEAGLPSHTLLVAAFTRPRQNAWGFEQRAFAVASLAGYADAVGRHADAVRMLALQSSVDQRLHVVAMLDRAGAAVHRHFVAELAELAVSTSKQVRAAAESLLLACGRDAVGPLKQWAGNGKPEQRLNALRLVWTLARDLSDDALATYATDTATADKAASVQALPEEWKTATAHEVADAGRYDYTVPVPDWHAEDSPQLHALLRSMMDEANQAIEQSNRQLRHAHEQNGGRWKLHQDDPYSDGQLRALFDALARPGPSKGTRRSGRQQRSYRFMIAPLQRLAGQPGVSVTALMKMLEHFGLLIDHEGRDLAGPACPAINRLHGTLGAPSLLEFSERLNAMGYDGPHAVFKAYCYGWGNALARDWPAEQVWPFFAHHLDRLLQLLNPTQTRDYWFDRQALYRAVATLPTPPATVVNAMYDLALGTGKSDRLPAQAALHQLPGKEARIIAALADGKAEVRAVAAQWLMRLRHAPAIPALERAVMKEKHDAAKGALLDALQALGQPVEKYLDRDALAGEAAKSLAKGAPKDLEWFPWAAMPTVHWTDDSQPVPPDVLRWLLVQAVKQKLPEPNAVLRKYCAMFVPRDREAFGQFVLEAWMGEDVRPIPPEDAMQRAKAQAASMHGYMRQYPQHYKDDPNAGKSVEELTAHYLPGFLRQPAGSAIGSKGLLAVAAACAGGDAAAPVGRYLKEYYGTRAAQGKALIAMLAWIEHPAATQLMLSVGSRFRTKSFQDEATRQAEALADRKGWTLAELADRTMPGGGFDETGVMELNYGSRVFSARLLSDFRIELSNPDGKKIAALPDPRQDDDAEQAKDAKKAFSAAKKQLKSIVELQTDRLYEALCTGRDWSFGDWDDYLNRHPVVRHLVQRLVWSARDGEGRAIATFRPLADGSLSDHEDNAVVLPRDARVRVAHDSHLPAADVAAWQQHLLDYEVASLFQQFGKGSYVLPADKDKATLVEDFEGHLIEAFSLRGRAGKLGYTRGSTEDGGWFMTYEKRFPTLSLVAVIEFTGNPLPEENRTVALINLSFASSQGNAWQRNALTLSDIPAVLLSECYNDLRLIAAEGTGFDPEWRKKSEY